MTDVIEERYFTLCQAFFSDPWGVEKFLVLTPSKVEAKARAARYSVKHFDRVPTKILVYPRTYVKEARTLYAAGKHD